MLQHQLKPEKCRISKYPKECLPIYESSGKSLYNVNHFFMLLRRYNSIVYRIEICKSY